MKLILKLLSVFVIMSLLTACSKEWLEEKQNIKLIVPTTLHDMDLLLNTDLLRLDGRGACETACDDYEFTTAQFNSFFYDLNRNLITWKSMELPKFGDLEANEWDLAYAEIQISNIVLEGLEKIERTENNKGQFDRIKGTALYHRAKEHLNLVMTFCKYYDRNTAGIDSGIPLKLTSDISEKIARATIQETYTNIISDLKQAALLLPIVQANQTFVAKGGAFGLLARTHLFTDNYAEALNASDSSYKYHSFVENYNNVDGSPARPFLNISTKEMHLIGILRRQSDNFRIGRVSSDLFELYAENDLRKTLFFKINADDGKATFRGSYQGGQLFTATATDEVLLIKAECSARLNQPAESRNALNLLLQNRFKTGTYIPISTNDKSELLDIIIKERRKELLGRGLRWQDLKRLNKDPKYAKTLVRQIGDDIFTLSPNDLKYIFPIPQYIKSFAGIE